MEKNEITDKQAIAIVKATFDPTWPKKKLKLESFLPSCPSIQTVGEVSAKTEEGYEMHFVVVQTWVKNIKAIFTPSGKRWESRLADNVHIMSDSLKETVTRALTFDPNVPKDEKDDYKITLDEVLVIRINGARVGNMHDHGPTKEGIRMPWLPSYYDMEDEKKAKEDFEKFKTYFWARRKERLAEKTKKANKKKARQGRMFS